MALRLAAGEAGYRCLVGVASSVVRTGVDLATGAVRLGLRAARHVPGVFEDREQPHEPAPPRPAEPTPAARAVVPTPPVADHVDVGIEPWEGYGQMRSQEIVRALSDGTPEVLAAVRLHERLNRNRRTVVEAVDRRLAELS